jgi:hypothetical protein
MGKLLQNFYASNRTLPVDTYWIWAELSGYRYFSIDDNQFPIIYEKSAKKKDPFLQQLHDGLFLNTVYDTHFGTALVPVGDLPKLLDCLKNGSLLRYQLCAPRSAASEPNDQSNAVVRHEAKTPDPAVVPANSGAIVSVAGIIDDGFALFHEHFRPKSPNASHVIAYWDQSYAIQNQPDYWSRQPCGAQYGAELTSARIAQAAEKIKRTLPPHQHNGEVFETACYAEVGMSMTHLLPSAHGSR